MVVSYKLVNSQFENSSQLQNNSAMLITINHVINIKTMVIVIRFASFQMVSIVFISSMYSCSFVWETLQFMSFLRREFFTHIGF